MTGLYIIFTQDKYRGADNLAQDTVTLMINGESFTSAHINEEESNNEADVAWLQLNYIPENMQTEKIAKIIAAFAKWVRFDWRTVDKQSKLDLPTLVRLLGFKEYKYLPWEHPGKHEKFIALRDATKITVEHLDHNFTSIDIL